MKASFFSVAAAMAMSAFAAPVTETSSPAVENRAVGEAVEGLSNIVTEKVGVAQIVDEITGGRQSPFQSECTTSGGLVTLLTELVDSVTSHTEAVNKTLEQVQSGELSKEEANLQVIDQFSVVHYSLTEVVTKLTGAAGLDIADGDVDLVLNLVVILVSQVLGTVQVIVTVLGLRPQLISLLHSVFSILASLLVLVVGLLAAVLPGLLAALSPLLATVGNGLLAPILTPVVALLATISLPAVPVV